MTNHNNNTTHLATWTCPACGHRQVEDVNEGHCDVTALMCSNCFGCTDLYAIDSGEMEAFYLQVRKVRGDMARGAKC